MTAAAGSPVPGSAGHTPTESHTRTAAADGQARSELPSATSTSIERDRRSWRPVLRYLALAMLAVGALLFWHGFHIDGHNSGDDFALYVNQARALVQGNVGGTLADNRFAVDNSAWHTFTPYAYPWGVPILLAPVMVITGTVDPVTGVDYEPLKLVMSVTFLIALFAFFEVSRRRVHVIAASLLILYFGTNFWYVTHTDQVLSELPFLMWSMVFVVWLDRVVAQGLLLGGSRRHLVTLGLIACIAFNTRREGLGLLVGLLAAQVVASWAATGAGPVRARLGRLRNLDPRALATPWTTFVAATVGAQLVLPSDFLPRYVERNPATDTGLHRIPDNVRSYQPQLGELLGLKDIGPNEITAFGSTWWGHVVLYGILAMALVGIGLALTTHVRRDAGLVGAALGVTLSVLVAPFQDYRYLMALVPFLLLFAVMGLTMSIRSVIDISPRWPVLAGEALVLALILGGVPDTRNALEYRSAWVGPQNGPQQPETLQMFEAVRDETRGDAVIVYGRARTMNLYTGRRSVQGTSIDFIERAGDYYVMYLERDGAPGTYSQYPLTDDEAAERGFTEVWRNDLWIMFRTPAAVTGR